MDDDDQLALFNKCIDSLASTIDVINEYSNEKDKQTKYLKEVITKDYCKIDLEYEKATNAIAKVEEELNNEDIDPSIDIAKLYEKHLQKEKNCDYLTHPVWYRIAKTEASVLEVTEANESGEENEEEYEEIDGSLLCSQAKSLSLDPLTKAAIKKPCKNKKCGHVYDYETISLHIKRRRKASACPYVGCNETVAMSDLCTQV